MGNNPNKQQRIVPERGYRIISITKKHIANQLNLLSDFIISPDPKLIDLRRDSIRFQVYSILSEDIRSVQLHILKGELGLQVRLDDINSCILRITKVFQGSPLQKYNIQSGDFIVGVLQGNFNCIKTFVQLITNITTIAPKANISLGICGEDGKTRIAVISVAQVKVWQTKRKGLLGCQLAQGWIHKWKPSKQRKQKSQETLTQPQIPLSPPSPPPKIPTLTVSTVQQSQQSPHSDSSNEIDRKCDRIDGHFNNQGVMQIKYKGILKSQQIVDASTICKCRPTNKSCQKCFIQKDQNYYFFCIKTNQIVAISNKLMLPTDQ